MHQVTIVGFPQALASAITGMLDLFRLAGVTWARIHDQPPAPQFDVALATLDGGPCRCINGVELNAQAALRERQHSDLVVVPTIGGPIDKVLGENRPLLEWLQDQHRRQTDIASNCTGAFLLAEAGLLDHRQATTHWGFSRQFRQRYPQVDLRPERLITADGNLFCAGGGVAWTDLGLYLVERYCGSDLARELAKAFVVDRGHTSQWAYGTLPALRYHQDEAILAIQDWLETHYADPVDIEGLAHRINLSPRTFLRRFTAATGDRPLTYLQRLRLENAKRYLETPHLTVEQVTRIVGYEDLSSFSRLFKRHTGLSPSAYRTRFSR